MKKEISLVEIRRFEERDAQAVSDLIAETLRTTNARDYPPDYIENDVQIFSPAYILRRAQATHFYVACEENAIIGCGAVGPYWDVPDECSLFTIFVLPAWQGRGVGRRIVQTLEADALALAARRIEIPASITARGFYEKMGYAYKNGVTTPDAELLLRMEKHRRPGAADACCLTAL